MAQPTVVAVPNSFTANTLIKSSEVNANFAALVAAANADKEVVSFDSQGADPATPGAGILFLYQKNGTFYTKNEFGTVTAVGSGSGGGAGGVNYISGSNANPSTSDFESDLLGWNGAASGATTVALRTYAATCTITIAAPAVVTKVGHGLSAGHPILFTTTASLPTGLVAGTTYYAKVIDADTFNVSATPGGVNIDTTGSQSGTQTLRPLRPTTATPTAAPASTLVRSTSSPLRGTASAVVTKTATISAGDANEVAFTIDSADKAKVLSISVDYAVSADFVASAGTIGSASDIQFFVIDTGNSNTLIPVNPAVVTGGSNGSFNFSGTFQTSSNSTTYKLVMLVATNNGNAYTMKIDAVSVGPQSAPQGLSATDYTPCTVTLSAGFGAATQNLVQKIVGDTLSIRGRIEIGTPTAGNGNFTLPNGKQIDIAKYNTPGGVAVQYVGRAQKTEVTGPIPNVNQNTNPTSFLFTFVSGQPGTVFLSYQTNVGEYVSSPMNSLFAAGDVLTVEIDVPIAGFSSSSLQSSEAATRIVACRVDSNDTTPLAGGDAVAWTQVLQDTHGAFDLGLRGFKAPVSGNYRIDALMLFNSSPSDVAIRVNGAIVKFLGNTSASFVTAGSAQVPLLADDLLTITVGTGVTPSGSASYTYLDISLIQGPANISVVDTVACAYGLTSATVVGAADTLVYDTKIVDTHGAYISGVFTAPISGTYRVAVINETTAGNARTYLEKEGTATVYLAYCGAGVTGSGSALVPLLADQTLEIVSNDAVTYAGGSAPFTNYLSIERIGN